MSQKTLVLLTSYRPSSKYRQSINRDEAESFWNACFVLWHPQLLAECSALPKLASPEDFETATTDHLFAIPDSPHRYQSGDWADRMKEAGSSSFVATLSWAETLEQASKATNLQLSKDGWIPFAALGMGYLILEAYCDAQDHENPLDATGFYDQLKSASVATEPEQRNHYLGQAAHLLHTAREVVNPSQLYQALSLFPTGSPADSKLGMWLQGNIPFTIVASSQWLESWNAQYPTEADRLKTRLREGSIDWWGGHWNEQEDALLPTSAWLANLEKGRSKAIELGAKHVESHGRSRYAASPVMPAVLQSFGIKRALGFSNDSGVWPHFNNSLAAWRGPDSQLLESCTRKPELIDTAEAAFHLGQIIYDSTSSEYVGWIHFTAKQVEDEIPLWFRCWAALHELAPVFGHMGNLEQTIRDIPATEQYTPTGADDFQSDYLLDLTGHGNLPATQPHPVARFTTAQLIWRNWEIARTFAAMHSSITPKQSGTSEAKSLQATATQLLQYPESQSLSDCLHQTSARLTDRLLAGTTAQQPGYLLLNPCSFPRNVLVSLPKATTLLPAPALASQKAEQGIDAVVQLPPLGFAWVPLAVEKGAKVRLPRQPLTNGTVLQNDHLVLEIDPQTGGLRSIRDVARQIPRLGQQLVFAPGSSMKCSEVRTLKSGLAVGEIQSIGTLVDSHDQLLAGFKQTFRLAANRKYAEIVIHLEPHQPLSGYPWHAYYASRWAWRDPNARTSKSVHWTKMPTMQTRPETQGFIELEMANGRAAIFSQGIPFWQRHGSRMLDSVLLVEGESSFDFTFAISLDDDLPHITQQDWLTPPIAVSTMNGPPTAGTSSWLFHLDAPSVIIMDLNIAEKSNSITLRLFETFGYATDGLLQCPRQPTAALVVNSLGEVQRQLTITDAGVALHFGCFEFQQVRLDFES